MGRQLIAMGMGMGIMSGREGRFYLRVVDRVRVRVIHWVVSVIFLVTFLVLAGLWAGMDMGIMPGREGRFYLRVVDRVRGSHGVVPVPFLITFLVLAGLWAGGGLRIPGVGFWALSR